MNKTGMKRTNKSAPTKENPEWTRASFAKSMSFSELSEGLQQALASRKRGGQKAPKKVPVSIRLSPDVVEAFRSTGAGWQARVDEILRTHIK
ncbi:MAG TPA: BrnA antitoxin family protein [Acidobacteriaceae bacterium]